jgi:tetratricopeptide (TPR) repeat protein
MTAETAAQSEDRFKKLIAVLTALITVLIAIVSFLQSDAGSRDDAANRDTKRYTLEAFGKQVSGDSRVNFDYNTAYQAYYELDLLTQAALAVDDQAAASRYAALRDNITTLSPMLAPPYFDEGTGELNIDKYEAETYLVEITALQERFAAASVVKDAWDSKSNTYIVHLTLLAVALFLFGLSTTISGASTRWIFAGVGIVVAIVASVWAGVVFAQPVIDLRQCRAADGTPSIDAFAQGVGLAYQNDFQGALGAYDKALECEPNYVNALVERGNANISLGNYEQAATDYERARVAGDNTASVAGDLAWTYYLLGRHDDAIAMNRTALEINPGELWVRYDLGLSLLAKGNIDGARAEYQNGMDLTSRLVSEARTAGKEPPSFLWAWLEDAALSLDDLVYTVETGEGPPAANSIAPTAVDAASDLSTQLKSLSVALEFTGQPPAAPLTATVSPFDFAESIYDEEGNFVDYVLADTFAYGAYEVAVLFDYEGMQDGQDVLFKVYIDGIEDPSWRVLDSWDLGASGSAEKLISFADSNTAVLAPGTYTVEMYVDSNLAQSGNFVVEE